MLVAVPTILLIWLPVAYLLSYYLRHKYGLITTTAREWWIGYTKSMGKILLLSIGIAEVFYWIVRASPDWWWLIVAILWSGTIIVRQYIPVGKLDAKMLIKLDVEEIIRRLSQLTERAGTPNIAICTLPWSKKSNLVNAWLVGLGRKRRIVLTDTLLKRFNYDEIEAILAHELAHHKNADIPKRVTLMIVTAFVTTLEAFCLIALFASARGLGGAADVATMPYLLLVYTMQLIIIPLITASRSRIAERNADHYAIELTGNADAFKSAMIKLADSNLIETNPSKGTRSVTQSYPTMGERIAVADISVDRQTPSATRQRRVVRRVKFG
jgi:STE24 endopeptidase